ncbi:MAG TPA: hypothetical protein VKQ72_12755 [Aggregatilineales bacterium]|nr:hypothetical protein [Aggregatilineales bacterium]
MPNFLTNLGNRLNTIPVLRDLIKFADQRPRLAAWIVLSVGIVVLLMIEARDVGLLIGQWLALIVASVLVAGLCIWIVTWDDTDEDTAAEADKAAAPQPPAAASSTEEPKQA